ncbi:hypothetical protein [Streptomyces sp. NPDC056061]|uniref:hypothetical protein n=1 Tax=Streptomyces sp. NPDC056061 TaxID=3345700 RepID=UPI0035DBFC59
MLVCWGSRAAAALPELRAALPEHPRAVPRSLAVVCPPERREATAELLSAAARSGPKDGRIAAAKPVRALRGRRPATHGDRRRARRRLAHLVERDLGVMTSGPGIGTNDERVRERAREAARLPGD